MKNFIQTKWFNYSAYVLLVFVIILSGFFVLHNNRTFNNVIVSFFETAENRSFDYRQYVKALYKRPVTDNRIVILAIDDLSFEFLWDKYGEWPVPRNVYADVINRIEQDSPQAIVFDMLFLKSIRASKNADEMFINTMNKYNNIYTGMNFDIHPEDVRKPIELPERLKMNLINNSDKNFTDKYTYSNCRPIMSDLLNGNVNVGLTSIIRNEDGIIRQVAPLMKYKENYYPYLVFSVGNDYLLQGNKDFTVDKDLNLRVKDVKIPLTKDGDTILNWYGMSGSHTTYPFYKLINEINSGKKTFDFKDKFVIIASTAVSLHDAKSVPVQKEVYPGVEVHATFLNNMLDNNFIKKTSNNINLLIVLTVIAIVGLVVMLSKSTLFALLSTTMFAIAYLFITYYVMVLFNLWVPVVLPIIAIIVAFTLSFLVKYLIKSRDFEYQYKLATIDGLTGLYNHRYFQESLKNQIEMAKRYNQKISLIITDIDFFKKFNDTYGHQSGDAVLRQVAQCLKKNSRTTDIVCRYGGEEMSIILPNTGIDEALNNANRILKAIEEKEFQINSTTKGHVTISLGIAVFPEHGNDAQSLIEAADKGLYYAKRHGRNQVAVFKQENNNSEE